MYGVWITTSTVDLSVVQLLIRSDASWSCVHQSAVLSPHASFILSIKTSCCRLMRRPARIVGSDFLSTWLWGLVVCNCAIDMLIFQHTDFPASNVYLSPFEPPVNNSLARPLSASIYPELCLTTRRLRLLTRIMYPPSTRATSHYLRRNKWPLVSSDLTTFAHLLIKITIYSDMHGCARWVCMFL